MRIVAGAFRGRRLRAPSGTKIRPTTDRVREAVFSIIASDLADAHVLDLFAGTGALGLEALSRGAAQAVFVDHDPQAVRLIQTNVSLCGVGDRVQIIQGAVLQVIRRLASQKNTFRLVFMDPPYGKGHIEKTLSELSKVANPETLVVVEHHVKDILTSPWEGWFRTESRRYGDSMVSFFIREVSG